MVGRRQQAPGTDAPVPAATEKLAILLINLNLFPCIVHMHELNQKLIHN